MPAFNKQKTRRNSLAAVALVVAAFATPGCSVLRYAKLVCIDEPKMFCERQDEVASMATYRSWADAAWAEQGAVCPEDCLEGDYGWGFRDGFAEYAYAGGTGEPPAVPPRPYWQIDLRSPQGHAAVESWFAGYRHGARLAREGGYRKRVTLNLSASLADCGAYGCRAESLATPSPASTIPVEADEPTSIRQPTELTFPSLLVPEPSSESYEEEIPAGPMKLPSTSPPAQPFKTTTRPLGSVAPSIGVPLESMPGTETGNAIFQITR